MYGSFFEEMCEIEKEAGLRNALKYALTGRSTFYHGTAPAIAKKIKTEGIKAEGTKGVIEYIKGLGGVDPTGGKSMAFMSRAKSMPRTYAIQQQGIQRAGRPAAILEDAKKAWKGKSVKGLWRAAKEGNTTIRKGVITVSMPARKLKAGVANPEPRQMMKKLLLPMEPGQEIVARLPYARDLALPATRGKTAILPKYIKGHKGYQRVSIPEVKGHVRDVIDNPRGAGKEFLRNLTGYQANPLKPF